MQEENYKTEQDELLVTYLTGMAGKAEREAAIAWIHESVENRRYFDELKEIYKAAKLAQPVNSYGTSAEWEKIKAIHYKQLSSKLYEKNKSETYAFVRVVLKYAAIIALAVSIGYAGLRYFDNKPVVLTGEKWSTIEVPYGSRTRVTLSDGSTVWLNAGSSLKYSPDFNRRNRKVILDGEAYFSVTPDSNNLFIVSTSYLDIKVFGTEFNVKAYNGEDHIETTLVSGSILLEGDIVSGSGQKSVTLEPNQTARYYIPDRSITKYSEDKTTEIKNIPKTSLRKAENLFVTNDINTALYTSWKDTVWYIEGESLLSLASKFERRFNIKFAFESKNIQNYRFTGTLKDEPLELVLNVLKLSFPIKYEIKNDMVVFSENKYFKVPYDEMLIKK